MYDKLTNCLAYVQRKTDFKPEIGVVLGSGLGDFADGIRIEETIDYENIEGFPNSTVSGHKGRLVFGYIEDIPIVIMQGRVHYYEGYPMSDVILPIRLMGLLGIKKLLLTNAAGGVNETFYPGSFMIIKDHILFGVPNPLIGPNLSELGTRFPDLSEIYTKPLRNAIRKASQELDINVHEGTYMQFTGPSYETPAEIKMSRVMGVDAVGMSTACEAIAARHMGIQVCGLSCITNLAAGLLDKSLSHHEVQDIANKVSIDFKNLVNRTITHM